jgi:hypothetical protein
VMRRTSSSSDAAIQLLRCPPAAARATGKTVIDLPSATPLVAPPLGSAALLRIALRHRSGRSATRGSNGLEKNRPDTSPGRGARASVRVLPIQFVAPRPFPIASPIP